MPVVVLKWLTRHYFASLRSCLLVIILLASIPAVAFSMKTAAEQKQSALMRAQDDAIRLARLAATEQERLVVSTRQFLTVLAQLPAISDASEGLCPALLGQLLRHYPSYDNVVVARPNGDIFCSILSYEEGANLSDRAVFHRALQTGDFAVGEYLVSNLTGKPAFPFAYPVVNDTGQVQAVLMVGVDLAWLNRLVAGMQLPASSTVSVTDRDGTVLAHYPDSEEWLGKQVAPEVIQTMRDQVEGVLEGNGPDGTARLYAFAPMTSSEEPVAFVRVGVPRAVAYAEAGRTLERNLFSLGTATLLTLAAAWIGSDRIIFRRLNTLVRATRRLSAGDLTARTGLSDDGGELSELACSFDLMAETLERREQESGIAREQIHRAATRAESLIRAAGRLNADLDIEKILQGVCEETARATNVPEVIVCLHDKEQDVFYPAAAYGVSLETTGTSQPIPRVQLDRYINEEEPVVTEGELPPAIARIVARSHPTSTVMGTVAATMMRGRQLVGLLIMPIRSDSTWLHDDELALFQGLADQAAMAIANAEVYAKVEMEGRARTSVLRRVIAAQEDERKRIARELHDELGQRLSMLKMRIELGRQTQTSSPDTAEQHLASAESIAAETIRELQSVITNLRPSLLDHLGLVPAIAWYGEQWLKPLEIDLQIRSNSDQQRQPQLVETVLFRIAQEALANVVKHSKATRVIITLETIGNETVLSIEDNGQGFSMPQTGILGPDGRGLGLLGMQERASLLGGECHVQSTSGAGTVVRVRVPLRSEAGSD